VLAEVPLHLLLVLLQIQLHLGRQMVELRRRVM
jgi:hypothetical protein